MIKRVFLSIFLVVLTIVMSFILIGDMIISRYSKYSYDDIERVPKKYAAIVLGTAKFLSNGRANDYFSFRIQAAAELYKHGKCTKILVSGDNSKPGYNEPADMKNALISVGVNSEDVVCDYAGFRTLDSIIRMKEVFGLTDAIVVSQRFHNDRAIYIGRSRGVDLWGYNAKDVTAYNGFKTRVRDCFSRAFSVLDIMIFNTGPRFYGPRIKI